MGMAHNDLHRYSLFKKSSKAHVQYVINKATGEQISRQEVSFILAEQCKTIMQKSCQMMNSKYWIKQICIEYKNYVREKYIANLLFIRQMYEKQLNVFFIHLNKIRNAFVL